MPVAIRDNFYPFCRCRDYSDLAFPSIKKRPLRFGLFLVGFWLMWIFDFEQVVSGLVSAQDVNRAVQSENGTSEGLQCGNNVFFIFISAISVTAQGQDGCPLLACFNLL